jgi:hypothetical protein
MLRWGTLESSPKALVRWNTILSTGTLCPSVVLVPVLNDSERMAAASTWFAQSRRFREVAWPTSLDGKKLSIPVSGCRFLDSGQSLTHSLSPPGNEYYTLFNFVTKAFQFDSLEDGGCPDVTGDHLPVCENATTILREHPEVFGPIPVPQPSPRKSIAHHQVEEREEVPFHIDADPAPLVGVDYTTGSLCEIMSTGDCKTLLYLGDDFKHPVLLSYDEGIVFVHLHTPPATLGCAPPRIIGYDYKSNSVVYNFTITENLSFIAADVNGRSNLGSSRNTRNTLTSFIHRWQNRWNHERGHQ